MLGRIRGNPVGLRENFGTKKIRPSGGKWAGLRRAALLVRFKYQPQYSAVATRTHQSLASCRILWVSYEPSVGMYLGIPQAGLYVLAGRSSRDSLRS